VAPDARVMAHCHWHERADRHPTFILLHGLEGSSSAHYMRGIADKAWAAGWNVVRLNQRNCGGTEHLSRGLYHSGLTHDPLFVLRELIEHDGLSAIAIAGYSLGGNLTLKLLERFPAARVTAVDAAPQMTEVTAARAEGADRLATVTARFEDLNFPPASFDLVASAMSLHHVADKAPLYARLFRWLAPGGALRVADQFLGATEAIQARHWDLWLAFCREPGHCTEAEIQSLIDHAAAHDHYEPLHAHFRYLAAAGFAVPDCVWRNSMYAVITAERP